MCVVLQTRTQFGDRCFAVGGPRVWNSLPAPLRDIDSINSFRKLLKTHLFSAAAAYSDYVCLRIPNTLTYLLTYLLCDIFGIEPAVMRMANRPPSGDDR